MGDESHRYSRENPNCNTALECKLISIIITSLPATSCRCLQSAENSDPQFDLQYRGPITMKGKKEPMKVWFLSRRTPLEGTEN